MMPDPHPIDRLFAALDALAPYPQGIVPVPTRIPGTAFFPGGHGLWRSDPAAPLGPLPVGGVMVLGHNWGDVGSHAAALRAGAEGMNEPTFRGLNAVLDAAAVDRAEVFLTNVYMGLLPRKSPVGEFTADGPFRARCREFLRRQFELMKPRAVLVLGGDALEAIAQTVPDLSCWLLRSGGRRTYVDIDRTGIAVCSARLITGERPVPVAALTHPWIANRQHSPRCGHPRRFAGLTHLAAEVEMVRSACEERAV